MCNGENHDPPTMLHAILQDLFFDKVDEVLRLLRKHNLETVFESADKSVAEMIAAGTINQVRLTAIAARVLHGVNSELTKISDPTEKLYVEITARDIGVYLFDRLIESSPNPINALQSIKAGLISACEIGGFNAAAMLHLLQFDAKERRYSSGTQKIATNYHYDWNGYAHDLDDLARNLKAEGCIQNVRDFKKLFDPIAKGLTVSVDRKQLPLLMTLVQELKAQYLIKPRGNKGHYKPLEVHCVDLDGNKLFDRKPGRLHYLLDKKAAAQVKLLEKVRSWISNYKLRSDFQVTLAKITKPRASA